MCQKLLALCVCCCALLTRAQIAVPIPLDPDVEILPTAGAVSSQYIHRIHNKFIPVFAPFTGVSAAAPIAPFPVAAPNIAVSPLVPVPRPLAPAVPTYQPALLPSYPLPLTDPTVISAPLVYPPTHVFRPAVVPTRIALLSPFARPLRTRVNYARRPFALRLRQRYG
uniref:Uncharacterized protein n=1 Tax=Ceratitis capitata TaxID=7213 RepID=W8B4N2_CERCA